MSAVDVVFSSGKSRCRRLNTVIDDEGTTCGEQRDGQSGANDNIHEPKHDVGQKGITCF